MAIGAREAQMRAMREERTRQASAPVRAVPRVEGVVRGVASASVPTPGDAVSNAGYEPVSSPGYDVSDLGYADFGKAMDALFAVVGREELATRLGVSEAAIKQARLRPDALARRSPPKGWQPAAAQLAQRQADHFARLAQALRVQR